MLAGAERIEREMAALERGVLGQDERLAGSVAITCCDRYVADLVLRELRPFCDEHPDIELAITIDDRVFDLARREADIAIRALAVGVAPPEYLIGLEVAPIVVASYVAAAHAARLDPEVEGARPRWLSFDNRTAHDAMIAGSSYPHLPPWGVLSSLDATVAATREGYGLAMLPTYVGDREPGLRRLARPDLRHLGDLWLLTHPDVRDNARFRATRTRIAGAFKAHAALFRGDG
jgi:DNA-binding transcriptional LysR family regulator